MGVENSDLVVLCTAIPVYSNPQITGAFGWLVSSKILTSRQQHGVTSGRITILFEGEWTVKVELKGQVQG